MLNLDSQSNAVEESKKRTTRSGGGNGGGGAIEYFSGAEVWALNESKGKQRSDEGKVLIAVGFNVFTNDEVVRQSRDLCRWGKGDPVHVMISQPLISM